MGKVDRDGLRTLGLYLGSQRGGELKLDLRSLFLTGYLLLGFVQCVEISSKQTLYPHIVVLGQSRTFPAYWAQSGLGKWGP